MGGKVLNPEALRRHLKRVDSGEATHHDADALREHIAALCADNAAMVAWIDHYGHAAWCPQNHSDKMEGCHETCAAHPIFSEPHPGAALLEEHRKTLVDVATFLSALHRIHTVVIAAGWDKAPQDSPEFRAFTEVAFFDPDSVTKHPGWQLLSTLNLYKGILDAWAKALGVCDEDSGPEAATEALNRMREEHRKALVLARNEWLERVVTHLRARTWVSYLDKRDVVEMVERMKEREP